MMEKGAGRACQSEKMVLWWRLYGKKADVSLGRDGGGQGCTLRKAGLKNFI